MAWCENEHCRKEGLRKDDVEFCDATHKVLCHGCFSLVHPGWIPPSEYVDLSNGMPRIVRNEPRLDFAIQLNDAGGLKAAISYGGYSLAFQASPEEIQQLFK